MTSSTLCSHCTRLTCNRRAINVRGTNEERKHLILWKRIVSVQPLIKRLLKGYKLEINGEEQQNIYCLVAKSCSILFQHHGLGSSVHAISQARILEGVAISFSRGSSWPRDWNHFSSIGRQILYQWAIRKASYSITGFLMLNHCFSLQILSTSYKGRMVRCSAMDLFGLLTFFNGGKPMFYHLIDDQGIWICL